MDTPVGGDEPPFEPLLHELDVAGGRGDEETVGGEAGDRAVVQDDARVVADDGVAGRADAQVGEPIGVDLVEQLGSVRAVHLQLAERAQVNDADALPDRPILRLDGLLLGVGCAVVEGALPVAHVHPDAAQLVVLVVHRRPLDGVVAGTGECAERHRRRRGAGGRSAGLADGFAGALGADGDRGELAHLALARPHRDRGVPLQGLDLVKALGDGSVYVLGGHVFAQADERALVSPGALPRAGCRCRCASTVLPVTSPTAVTWSGNDSTT